MTTPSASNAARLAQAADALRFEAIAEAADIAASCWRSLAEAAYRNERGLVQLHCKQVAAVTTQTFAVAKALGASPSAENAA